MNKVNYGVVKKAELKFPVRNLLVSPHKGKNLTVGYPAFGNDYYKENLTAMAENYSHPLTGEKISFRPATTSESISVAVHGFGKKGEVDSKRDILDPRWLQLGYIVRTQDGIFTNTTEKDESKLNLLLNNAEEVNGIYLLKNGVAFAPYESFKTGVQDCDTFAEGGLARALEHTRDKTAEKIRQMASPEFYEEGVDVWRFDKAKKPILRVVGLDSGGSVGGGWFTLYGDYENVSNGHAFGVLKEE
jgi:hypothetical protein